MFKGLGSNSNVSKDKEIIPMIKRNVQKDRVGIQMFKSKR